MNARNSLRWNLRTVVAVASAVVVGACTDTRPDRIPTAPNLVPGARSSTLGACTTVENLNALASDVFGAGSPNVNSVLGKIDNMAKKVAAGDTAGAQNQANNIVSFVQEKAAQGTLPGTQAQITAFISGVLCYAGLSPDTFLILPTDDPQIRTSSDGLSGVSLLGNTVAVPTLLSLTVLDPAEGSPLDTKLDQYPSYVSITSSSQLTKPAIVAVCPTGAMPTEVRERLRLGHQASSGFNITPAADGSFLPCTTSTAQSRLGGILHNVASLFLPRPLYAAVTRRFYGGVGGTASEFSPFGAIDPELSFAGGVGGTAGEFKKRPASPTGFDTAQGSGPAKPQPGDGAPDVALTPDGAAFLVAGGVCTEVSATVGTALEPECRPEITLTTHNGTIFEQVPVSWAVTAGDGVIAPETVATEACGSFGASAATTTDATGKAGVCWTLGPNGGTNKATATPSAGGDAPAGVTFSPAILYFTAEALKITPTVTATGGSFVYDAVAHPGSGSCSDGLTPALTYSNGSAPVAVGTYTLTVTCGAGSTVYNTVTADAAINIAVAVPTVAVTCPASVTYNGSAQEPCTATATAPGLSLTPTPVYTNNTNAGTATATVSLPADGNYGAASGSATFAINAAATTTTVTCTSPVTYTGAALAPCTGTTTGPGALNTSTPPTYVANVNAGTATATATYAGGGNYLGSTGSATFTIAKAASATTLSCPTSATYTGAPLTPCSASVTGAGGLSQSLAPTYSNNVAAGTANVSAAYPGDANHLASGATATFAINKAPTSVAVSCSSAAYTGAVQSPCTATATGAALSVAVGVTYVPSPVLNAASYIATGTYSGDGNHFGSSGTATFSITKLGATATPGSATINFGDPVPTSLPCTISGLLGVDAGSVTCTTGIPAVTVAGTYATTAIVSPTNPTNYSITALTGSLTVAPYVQVGCFASPVYSEMPETKSAQRNGSNLPIKCTLTNQQGVSVTTATGDITVIDVGEQATTPPIKVGTTVFTGTNVFKFSRGGGGNYAFGLDTGMPGFFPGRYYYVIANWNDGTTTEGWFLLK